MDLNKVRNIINSVKDPDIGISLKDLDSIDKIEIIDENSAKEVVKIVLKLIQPIYWVARPINNLIINELRKEFPNTKFEILVTEKAQDFNSRPVLPGIKNIIAVASGKGGVGKSSVAANIAASLSSMGANVGILDGDITGPSQPTMFDLEGNKMQAVQFEDGTTKAIPTLKHGVNVASMGFILEQQEAAIVRGPMLAGYFSMLFEQIHWGNLDFLIFDLPPGTGDIQLTLTQKIPLTGAVVITTPQEISVADVRRSITMFDKVDVDVLGVIENMSYFVPPDMPDKKYFIFGEGGGESVSKEMNVDFLGQIPLSMDMREANDGGEPLVIKYPESKQADQINKITNNIVSKIRLKNKELMEVPTVQIKL